MLIHRKNCVDQFRQEIAAAGKDDRITIDTYQRLQTAALHGNPDELAGYGYIVSDEFQYFVDDSGFNFGTDVSFDTIMDSPGNKIFLSATGDMVVDYLREHYRVEPLVYDLTADLAPGQSNISSLYFYGSSDVLPELAHETIAGGFKAVFFIRQAKAAYQLYRKFERYAVFNCSKSNRSGYYKYVDEDRISRILADQKFDCQLLITTSCMDAGINLYDPEIRRIVIDGFKDPSVIMQFAGRKRIRADDDKADVYIRSYSNQSLAGQISQTKNALVKADYLKTHTVEEYLTEYPREASKDPKNIVYDERIPGEPDKCTKKVNPVMYYKRQKDIEILNYMINLGEYGFCKYMADKFGVATYEVIQRPDTSLVAYLEKIADNPEYVMLQSKDRQELIEKIDARSDGKLIKSLKVLNAVLEDFELPYQIEQFRIVKTEDGRRKDYKNAWRVVSHDWNVKTE